MSMIAALKLSAYTPVPRVARGRWLRLMEVENQTARKPSPLHEPVQQRPGSQSGWPDAWLINAVRRDPPDEAALNVLVERYWRPLYARCRMLALDVETARDLAQEAWLRVLRARHSLEPDGHFQAYIITIATNLWRDRSRAAYRAGAIAEHRLASLDAPIAADEGEESISLINVLADPRTLSSDDQLLVEMDLDHALGRLEPRLREVLVARYISGESAAEIGKRYGRTEQAITGWIREAARQMRTFLGERRGDAKSTEDR